jgi:hypothetical protein
MGRSIMQRSCFTTHAQASPRSGSHAFTRVLFALAFLLTPGCKKSSAVSAEKAALHAAYLTKTIAADVAEVRSGLPQGVQYLLPLFKGPKPASDDPRGAHVALDTARNKVQDLRVAKSTFFAVTDAAGIVIRNDQDVDAMAGRPLFESFPELRNALSGRYIETHGSMPEASGVKGRADGQWVAAQPIAEGPEAKGLFVTGWSWAAYAYRLERALGSELRAALGDGSAKLPLFYVYLLVDKHAFGTPISPEVNARAIERLAPLERTKPGAPASFELEITGREFGLGVARVEILGSDIGVGVLRSET